MPRSHFLSLTVEDLLAAGELVLTHTQQDGVVRGKKMADSRPLQKSAEHL